MPRLKEKFLLAIIYCFSSAVGYSQSLDSFEIVAQNLMETNPKNLSLLEIESIIQLSDTLLQINVEKSIDYIEFALTHASNIQDDGHTEMTALGVYANGLLYANQIDTTIEILQATITKYDGKSINKSFFNDYGSLFQYMGFAYRNKSQFVEAAEQFSMASEYFEKGEDLKKQINAKYNQANLLNQVGYLDKAEKAYLQLLAITDRLMVKQVCYSSLGIVESKRKNYKKAEVYFLKSLDLIEHSNEPELIYLNLGVNYRELGNILAAKTAYLKAAAICKETKRTRRLSLIYPGLAKTFYEEENYPEAKKYLTLAEEVISPQNYREKGIIHETRSKIYEVEGNWEGAHKELINKMIYQDSISDERRAADIADIEEKYQTEKKESENKFLKQEAALKDATIQKQKLILISAIAIIGLLALLVFVLFRQSVERKRTNQLLKEKNEKIELLHKELEHRVRNNLAFVSSLLKMQGRRISNEEAKQAIKAGEARIEAMSLLHRKLFMEEGNSIKLGEYLKELCVNLQNTYPVVGKVPIIDLKTVDLEIDGETAVRIGLIVNELTTNSFKHAFTQESNPTIEIEFMSSSINHIQLTYRDSGKGIPADLDITSSSSLGLKLIHTLTKQLNGQLIQTNDNGAHFKFIFSPFTITI